MARCHACQTPYGAETLICPRDGTLLGDGTLDGRYRVHRQIGEGGMGVVYLAEHIVLQKRVAVKVLKGELSSDPALARRFELEAITASRIGHESIVDVTDFGRTGEGALYFVMEYLDGQSLSSVVRQRGRLELRRSLDVLAQVAHALEAAHANGIVHRDIKPQNVMLLRRRDGTDAVKLLDFGVSKVSTDRAEPLTQQGALLGTAEYMSPEQANGDAVDARTDIYAFGVMAYELVTGSLPFKAKGTLNVLLKHLHEAPEPPGQRAPGLPPSLEELILQALAKRPEDRPQTMGEVSSALEAVRRALPPEAAPAVGPQLAAPPRDTFPSAPRREAATGVLFQKRASAVEPLADTVVSSRSRKSLPVGCPPAPAPPRSLPPEPPTAQDDLPRNLRSRTPIWVLLGAAALVAAGGAWLLRPLAPPSAPEAAPAPAATPSPAPASAAARPEADTAAPAGPALPAPPPRVTLRTSPPGASVYRGDQVLGTTPLTLEAPAGALRVTLDGYQPERVEVPPGSDAFEVTLTRSGPRPHAPARPGHKAAPYNKVEDLKPSPY